MQNYKSEASINKMLAQLQLAGAAISEDDLNKDTDSFEEIIRHALEAENEAIKIYLQLKEKSEQLGSAILVKAFDELANDEREHVGNLQYLMKLICPNAIDSEKEGEAEEAKLQAET